MVMSHGDNKGLVLPPRVAPTQAVIIPIIFADQSEADIAELRAYSAEVVKALKAKGVKVTDQPTADNLINPILT